MITINFSFIESHIAFRITLDGSKFENLTILMSFQKEVLRIILGLTDFIFMWYSYSEQRFSGKSLKDPKEYVAYLNELRAMDPAYMRFTIDKRQRKPQSALSNLAQCPDRRDECLQYVKDTGLYTLALELLKDQPDMWVTGQG